MRVLGFVPIVCLRILENAVIATNIHCMLIIMLELRKVLGGPTIVELRRVVIIVHKS